MECFDERLEIMFFYKTCYISFNLLIKEFRRTLFSLGKALQKFNEEEEGKEGNDNEDNSDWYHFNQKFISIFIKNDLAWFKILYSFIFAL